jgi:hypothetical protein
MQSKRILAVLNTLGILGMIIMNAIVSARGINGNTIGGISDRYDTLFTPAGYAFAIWGVIYLLWIGFVLFQLSMVYKKNADTGFILQIGPWLLVNSMANITWIFAWVNESIGLSLILMLVILTSLIIMIIRLNMERWDAPFPIIVFVWWPICVYCGWIAVATIANVSAYLTSIGWEKLFSAQSWTVIMLIVAICLNLLMVLYRNMREFAAVGIWALIAIAYRQWDVYPMIQWTALSGAIILSIAISIHGYMNRATNPLSKFREYNAGENSSFK